MRKWLETLRPNPWLARRLAVGIVVAGVGVAAFCWGRHVSPTAPDVQPTESSVGVLPVSQREQPKTDYERRAVAYIYDNIPISRADLGEYLIDRFGAERVEFLVNRRIVEMKCKSQGIVVTDLEVEIQLKQDIASFGKHMTEQLFVNQVLGKFHKTLYEYKEDVIRPRLAMVKLVQPTIVVMPEDVQREFESRYGPRVQCRMIVLQKEIPEPRRVELWQRVCKSEDAFLEEAGKQAIPELASRKGDIPPIHKHFPDPAIEKEAFRLKPGEVSAIIPIPDGTGAHVILRCEKHLLEDRSKRIEDERMILSQQIEQRKLAARIPEVLQELRRQAMPRIVLGGQTPPAVRPGGSQRMVPPPVVN
jgi:hypothetical protein